jgi:predicted transcriptional regulator
MKIKDDELKTVRSNRELVERSASTLSDLQIRQVVLNDLIEKSKSQFLEAMNIEDEFLSKLKDTYGDGMLDVETGELEINNGE